MGDWLASAFGGSGIGRYRDEHLAFMHSVWVGTMLGLWVGQ